MSNSGQNPPENLPEWLPSGWTVEIRSNHGRNVKAYVEPTTGHRFYSKPKVLEYIRTVKNYNRTSQMETAGHDYDINLPETFNQTPNLLPHRPVTETPPRENLSHSGKSFEPVASEPLHFGEVEAEKSPDWLPSGWTEEVKVKDGRIVKTYVDPLWGHRFYTKPQVLQYLGAVMNDSSSSQKEISGNNSENNLLGKMNGTPEPLPHVSTISTHWENGSQSKLSQLGSSDMSNSSRMVAEKTPDWLPAGWTEEVKVNNGRRYKSFVDQLSGRRFYSKPKVLEYLGAAKNGDRISEKKKMANDFDINLPVNITDPLEPLPHGRFTGLESRKKGSQSGKSLEREVDTTEGVTPVPQLVESQNTNTFDSIIHPKATSSRARAGRKRDINETDGVIPVPQLIESQSRNTFESTIRPKATSSRNRAGRKPLVVETGVGSPSPQQVEYQNGESFSGYTSTTKETSSRKGPGKRYGLPMDNTEVVTPLPQFVESQSMYTPSKETTSSKQPGGKVIMNQLSEELPPGWITEIKIKKTGNQTKKIKYYIDPASGYVFSSKKDVWRYSEAGDVSKCAMKPKKREEMGFNTKYSSPNVDKIGSRGPLQKLEEPRQASLQELDEPKHVNTRKQTHYSPEVGKLSSTKQCDSEMVIERVTAEGLPSGWIKEVKTEKFYTDPRSGYVFMSQKDALLYLETGDIGTCAVKPRSRDELGLNDGSTPKTNKAGGGRPLQQLEKPRNDNTPRLTRSRQNQVSSSKQPSGEIVVEGVTPNGTPGGTSKATSTRKDTMSKTSGKPALQQLEQSPDVNTPKHASLSSPQKEVTSSKHNGIEILFERVAPTGLPPGWIKEIRIQKRADGIRKDLFFTDPASGYAFRSQKDVFRFVKTGDVRSCAMKPKKREELGCNQVSNIASSIDVQKPQHDTTEKQPSSGKVGSKRSFDTMDSDVSQRRRQTRSTAIASPAVAQKVVSGASEKQLTNTTPNKGSLGTLGSDVSQARRQTRSAITSPAVMQKLEHNTTKQQLSTGKVGSKRSLETMDSDVHQKQRQTRSATSAAVLEKVGCDTPEKQLSTGKKVGSKRSLETMGSDVSQKRRQTRSSAVVVTADTPTAGLPEEVPKLDKVKQKPTKSQKGNASKSPPQTRTKASERERDSICSPPSTVNGKVKSVRSTPSTVNVKVKNVRSPPSSKKLKVKNAKKKAEKNSNKKILSPASKSKKKETKKEIRTPPSRISKRILGIGAETVTSSGVTELALPSTVKKARKNKDIPCLTDPNNLALCEQAAPTTEVQTSGEGNGTSCPTAQNNVESFEQTLNSELENSGKTEHVPCPNAPNNVADNTPQEPESVPEVGDSEVENFCKNKDIQCLDNPVDVFHDAPEELETVSVIKERNHALGDVEAVLIAEGSNKSNEAAANQVENQNVSPEKPTEVSDQSKAMENQDEYLTISQEQPSEVSTQSKAIGNQEEDVVISQEQPVELSNQRNEAADDEVEDQMVSQELPAEVSNKGEAMEDQTEEQTISQEPPAEVSNKTMEDKVKNQTVPQDQPAKVSNKTMEDEAEDQTVSQEQLVELENKSESMEDRIENETVSQEQTAEVSYKTMEDKAEDQTVSQEQPAEVSSKSESMEDQTENQTVSQEQPTKESNKSDSIEDQAEGETISQEPPTQGSNKSREAEGEDKNQTISQDQQMYQFGEESWSDPCLDFAFKTLTGTLSFDDNVFQARDDASQAKSADNCLTMLDFDATQANNSHSQNASDTLPQVDNSDTHEALVIPGTECPTAPIYLPDMNSNLPTASETAPHQTDFEEDKNDDKNELTLDNYARFLF